MGAGSSLLALLLVDHHVVLTAWHGVETASATHGYLVTTAEGERVLLRLDGVASTLLCKCLIVQPIMYISRSSLASSGATEAPLLHNPLTNAINLGSVLHGLRVAQGHGVLLAFELLADAPVPIQILHGVGVYHMLMIYSLCLLQA